MESSAAASTAAQMGEITPLAGATFEHFVKGSPAALVLFGWDKLPDCRRAKAALSQAIADLKSSIPIGSLDFMENLSLCESLGLRTVPCLIAWQNGKLFSRLSGSIDAAALRGIIKSLAQ